MEQEIGNVSPPALMAIGAAAAKAASVPRLARSHVSPRGTAVARGSGLALGN